MGFRTGPDNLHIWFRQHLFRKMEGIFLRRANRFWRYPAFLRRVREPFNHKQTLRKLAIIQTDLVLKSFRVPAPIVGHARSLEGGIKRIERTILMFMARLRKIASLISGRR